MTYNLAPILKENVKIALSNSWHSLQPNGGWLYSGIVGLFEELHNRTKNDPSDENIQLAARRMLANEYQELHVKQIQCGGPHPALNLANSWMKINHLKSILRYKNGNV